MVDKAVKKIRPDDQQLSMVQDNLANAIQQLLDYANGASAQQSVLAPIMQQLAGAGTPYTVKTPALQVKGRTDGPFIPNQPTMILGEAQYNNAQGVTVPQRDNEIFSYGQIVAFGSQIAPDGFVIIPVVSGSAFRVAPNNTYTCFQVNFDGSAGCTGNFNAASFTNTNGFKTVLDVGQVWNSAAPAGGTYQTQYAVANQNGNGLGLTPFVYKFSHSGSVVGWSFNNAGPALGNMGLRIYKNGAQINNITVGSGGSNATFWGTIAKGVNAFSAGDTLTVYLACTNAGNFQASAHLTLEMAA
jgi:hypothetical protein